MDYSTLAKFQRVRLQRCDDLFTVHSFAVADKGVWFQPLLLTKCGNRVNNEAKSKRVFDFIKSGRSSWCPSDFFLSSWFRIGAAPPLEQGMNVPDISRAPTAKCLKVDKTTGKQYLMEDEEFVRDDKKAASNWLDHHVSFEVARDAFKDAFAVEWIDNRHNDNEERLGLLGMVGARVLHVSFTMRGEKIRIISARLAEPYERRRYHNENRI